MKIDITLAERDVGTTALVTRPRLFRKPEVRRYVCAKADPWGGGRWICVVTGAHADGQLEHALNLAAQGTAMLSALGLK